MRLLSQSAAAGWPLSATLALALAGLSIRAGRRRNALNEALHELRRPLQAMALSAPERDGPARLSALARVDAELNGRQRERRLGPVPCRALVEAAIGRWRSRAGLAGGRIELRWRAGVPVLRGDRAELSQALDNLLVNAIEHGGPLITVDAITRGKSADRRRRQRLRLEAALEGGLPGRGGRQAQRPPPPRARPQRGPRVAASHGGRFALERSDRGSIAVLELPLGAAQPRRAA